MAGRPPRSWPDPYRVAAREVEQAQSREQCDGGRTNPAPESWRIVVFTNIPGGVIFSLVDGVVRPLGHRVVGVVTSPGPKRRRSPAYLEVVAAVPPGIDVIVSNHPERWAAMLAPLRPDLIISGGFPWRIPPRSSRCLGSGRSTCTPHCCLGTAARPPSSGPFVTGTPSWASLSTDSRLTSIPARSWRRRASRSPTTTTSTRSWPSSVRAPRPPRASARAGGTRRSR